MSQRAYLFQSLLSWITDWASSQLPSLSLRLAKFQSLLSWITDWAIAALQTAAGVPKVSILVVVDYGLGHGVVEHVGTNQVGFQSLLSWITDWAEPFRKGRQWRTSRFNPCCRGLRTGPRRLRRHKCK